MRTSLSIHRPAALVVGATGAQGGAVARHLIARGRFDVRVLVRDPAARAAQALQAAGAELVPGDLADRASLHRALEGVHSVFGVTSWWEHGEREYALGRNLLLALSESGVRHVVLSTLAGASRATGGTLMVPSHDIKAQLEEDARTLSLPATFARLALYYESFFFLVPPTRGTDGRLRLALPLGDRALAAVSVSDAGAVVARIMEEPDVYAGATVNVVGDQRPVAEYAEHLGHALGEAVEYRAVTREAFEGCGLPHAEALGPLLEWQRRASCPRLAAIAECRQLFPELRSFDRWMVQQGHRFADLLAA